MSFPNGVKWISNGSCHRLVQVDLKQNQTTPTTAVVCVVMNCENEHVENDMDAS